MRSRDLARIVHDDESLYMPAHNPYEFQTLFEELAWYARQYGSVRLEFDEHVFTVRGREAAARCGGCGALTVPTLQERNDSPLCVRCASAKLYPRFKQPPARYAARRHVI